MPGDIAAIRHAVMSDDVGRRARRHLELIKSGNKLGPADHWSIALDYASAEWLRRAVPYFVDLSTLVGLVDCAIPTEDDLTDLVLPSDAVAMFVGGGIAVPMDIIEADSSIRDLGLRHDSAFAMRPEWVSADEAPPSVITGPQLAIHRQQPVRACGIVLHADASGRLDDLVMWLTVVPDHVEVPRTMIYG